MHKVICWAAQQAEAAVASAARLLGLVTLLI